MSIPGRLATTIVLSSALAMSSQAYAQVKLDVTEPDARKSAGIVYLEDLSVNDKAFIYNDFCVKDDSLYVPGWITPADLSGNEYNSTGILLKIEVLSGRRLRAQFVDAAQAQSIARGNQKSPPVLDDSGYKNAILAQINDLYRATIFGTVDCDELQRQNTLRTLTLYSVETLNWFTKISDLLRYAKSGSK